MQIEKDLDKAVDETKQEVGKEVDKAEGKTEEVVATGEQQQEAEVTNTHRFL